MSRPRARNALAPFDPTVTQRTIAVDPDPRPGSRHTRLQQRRPVAVRRHAARTLVRVAGILGGDLCAVWVTVALARVLLELPGAMRMPVPTPDAVPSFAHFAAAVFVGLLVTGNYGRRRGPWSSVALLRGTTLAVTLTYWNVVLSVGPLGALLPYLLTVLVAWGALLLARQLTDAFLWRLWPNLLGAPSAVLVGPASDERDVDPRAHSLVQRHYRYLGRVALDRANSEGAIGRIEEFAELIDRFEVETVVIGGKLSDEHLAEVLDVSLTAGCEILCPAGAVTVAGARPKLVWRESEAFLELGAPVLKAQELFVKRVVDICGAAVGIAALWPIGLVIAAAVKLDSSGPVLFAQNRAGLGGRRFRMLKFRTMRDGADQEKRDLAHLNCTGDSRLFKIPNDPRVTRLGAWLRRWSLDELPQLWNVLVGDMSLVGPRPFFEADLEAYEDHHFRRLSAKPGITGLWQVSGRSAVVDFEEVVRLDREYIERWSIWLDLLIMARTLPTVFGRNGAY